jgi:periplasmic protein CpxP/Spy
MIKSSKAFLAAALFAGVSAVTLTPSNAQTAPAPAKQAGAQTEPRHHAGMLPSQLVDGRIAFLKAELKIAPAQEAQWQQVATAMRDNAQALDQAMTTARQNRGAMNAVQRIELRGQFAKARADNDARLLAAFKPLYASLSPEQQQLANQLVGPHHHWRHRA